MLNGKANLKRADIISTAQEKSVTLESGKSINFKIILHKAFGIVFFSKYESHYFCPDFACLLYCITTYFENVEMVFGRSNDVSLINTLCWYFIVFTEQGVCHLQG